jgi:hypothetical protein
MSTTTSLLTACVLVACLWAGARGAEALTAWAVDPHVKVFADDAPPAGPHAAIRLRAARNEVEPGQLALRAAGALRACRVQVSDLRPAKGGAIPAAHVEWNFVGFIPLKTNTPGAEQVRLRAAPCRVSDPLLADRQMNLAAGATQPVWLTVRVPKDAPAGVYRGEVSITAGAARAAVPVELTVDDFTLPDERHLRVTNWFSVERIAKAHRVALWGEEFWTLLERYARNMADHRQNVVYVPWTLIEVSRAADGKLSFDYGRFDRFVELFQRAGCADRIEITHVAHFGKGGWGGSEIVLRDVPATDGKTGKAVRLPPREALGLLLADLQRHLAQRAWLDKAMIHVADEPSVNNLPSWREASAFVHEAAPRIRRIDAIEGIDFSGALEVWVPKLSHFDRWREAYDARRGGSEMWYYICCHPFGGVYPNRFLDYPLARVRVLHWINFAADLAGYLHWGLNFWSDEPFGTPSDRLPPGDTHVIYPGPDGPLSSIRWQMQRRSIQDYEELHLLAATTAEAKKRLGKAAEWIDPRRRAMELCRRVVPGIGDTEADPESIVAARNDVADEIVALGREPLLLVQTEPAAGWVLIYGPIAVEVHGAVERGTSVKVDGRAVDVRADGRFDCVLHFSPTAKEVRIEAEKSGTKKLALRTFRVRK